MVEALAERVQQRVVRRRALRVGCYCLLHQEVKDLEGGRQQLLHNGLQLGGSRFFHRRWVTEILVWFEEHVHRLQCVRRQDGGRAVAIHQVAASNVRGILGFEAFRTKCQFGFTNCIEYDVHETVVKMTRCLLQHFVL